MDFLRFPVLMPLILGCVLAPVALSRVAADPTAAAKVTCPVTKATFVDGPGHPGYVVDGKRVAFCCTNCPKTFAANPEKYITNDMLGNCPIMGGHNHVSAQERVVLNNQLQYFCCPGCDTAFKKDLSKYVKSLPDVVSGKDFTPAAGSPRSDYKTQVYLFDNAADKATFDKSPEKYAVLFGAKPAG